MRELSEKHLLAFALVLVLSVGVQAQSGTRGAISSGSSTRSAPAPSYQSPAPIYSSPAPVGQVTEGAIVHESMPMQGTIVHSSSPCQASTVYYQPTYSSAPIYSAPIVTGSVGSAPMYSASLAFKFS